MADCRLEGAPKKKLKHSATVSYNSATVSSRLSVVADPNSTVYKLLTTEEVDTLLSRPRWREFASNLLARGFVVYKKRDSMVYVFDHEGGIVSRTTFESVSTFLRGFPVPDVPVAGNTVAHRAANSVQSSGAVPHRVDDGSAELREAAARGEVRLLRPQRTDDGSAELREAAARSEVRLRRPQRTDDGSAEQKDAAARGEVRLLRPRRTDDGSAELAEAAARGEVLLIPSKAGHFQPSKEALKQQRLLARVFDWKDERLLSEQQAAANTMVADLVGPLRRLLNEDAGDRHYVGGACSRRAGVEADDGRMPLCLSKNEMVRALLAQDAVIRIRSTGAKVGCKQLRRWIEAGRLIFFRSRVDASPQVCDLAESLAQTAMHTTHPLSSTVRMHAAGTVAARGYVEAEGYRIFAWVVRGAALDPELSVAKVSRREVTATDAERAAQSAAYRPRGMSDAQRRALAELPCTVRLQRLTGAASGYTSHVEGPVHVRTWGLLRDREQWASYTLDFGPGGETAALASHARIVRAKTSAKYAARRGAYDVLEEDEVWSVPTGNRSAAEEEAEALVQQHMLFVLGSGSTLATDEPAAGEDEDAEDEDEDEDEDADEDA